MTYASLVGAGAAKTAGYYETKKSKASGQTSQTVGKPKLSEKAQKYYEELKKKYSDMDFVLVDSDEKDSVKAQAGNYGRADRTVVIIGEDELEQMAKDAGTRKKYEGVIDDARNQISQLKDSLEDSGLSVKSFGIQLNDNGTTTLFASLEKNSSAQRERIEKSAEKKSAQSKADKKAGKQEDDTITFTANSVEELLQKINDYSFMRRSDNVQTAEEKLVGQSFDLWS